MISVDLGVTRSKVKVTEALYVRIFSADYLKAFYHKVFIFAYGLVITHIDSS
jgi:hypothetical protein